MTDTLAAVLLWLTGLAPLLGAAALLPRRGRGRVLPWLPATALPALAAALVLPAGTRHQADALLLGAVLGLDPTGRALLSATALLWAASGWFALRYLAGDRHRVRFFVWFQLAMGGSLGLLVALDAATFLVFYALMGLAAYGLVIHHGDAAALRAGRYYMALAVASEVLVFTALAGSALPDAAPPLRVEPGWALPVLLLGLGIKAGALGVHVWLPLAHPEAPVPASAVLSGAMIKAGLVGWVRFLPLGDTALAGWGAALTALGLAAAFYGVLAGLAQRAPKVILAYSSISQMGLMTAAVGFVLLVPALHGPALAAIALYAVHHGLVKGALFLGVGVWQQTPRPWVLAGLATAALALAGAPLSGGALAKAGLDPLAAALPAPWPAWLALLLPLAAVGTALLMLRLLFRLPAAAPSASAGTAAPWLALLCAALLLPWLSAPQAPSVLAAAALSLKPLLPLAAGVAIALWALRFPPQRLLALAARVPPGDLLAWAEGAWTARRGTSAPGRSSSPDAGTRFTQRRE